MRRPEPPNSDGHQVNPGVTRLDRAAMIKQLGGESFDLAVIGGGINGAAIAREASLRGLKVALIDRGDFAGATSSHSSKLIHGGLRYLPQGQIRLVYHALRERERLRRITAPHLVRPIKFVMPFYRGRRPGRFAILAGLSLYDVMAWTPRAESHQRLSARQVHSIEPNLLRDELTGGAVYYDGWGDDARLTLENILDAAYHGAAVANYTTAKEFGRTDGHISSIIVRDGETGAGVEIRARHFVNAAGPWVDYVRALDEPSCTPSVRLTKGVHLIVAADRLPIRNALVLTDRGGRIVFVMPYQGWILIGTTDTAFDGDPQALKVEKEDIIYLLNVTAEALPDFRLDLPDVAYAFAGLRALPIGPTDNPSAIPRDEILIESSSGLITVAGGKLTTHRAIAETVVDRILSLMHHPVEVSSSRVAPLPGARPLAGSSDCVKRLPQEIQQALADRYGTRATIVASLIAESHKLAEPIVEGSFVIGAEVIFAVRYELARSLSDFLVRRTSMIWRTPPAALAAAPEVARLMAAELGWSAAREKSNIAEFNRLTLSGNLYC